jgi:DNA-binding MarR family transcriptional regulator
MLIIRCRRLMWNEASRRLDEVGESLHRYRLLSELARCGPASQRDLADATAQHPAAISRLVDELEVAGLIRRRRGRQDRRQIIVAITARGRVRVQEMSPVAVSGIEEVLAPLSAARQRRLAALLTEVLDAYADARSR